MERTITLDPRSPFVLDTRELGRRPGHQYLVRRTVAAPEDIGTTVIGIPAGSEIDLDLRLESVMEGVLVSGTVRGQASGECVRCLDAVDLVVEAQVQELFVYPADASAQGQGQQDDEDEDDELRELDGDLIDVEPTLRDAVVTLLPFQPLCRDDCPGLCSECGVRLADEPDHEHETIDPRWAALREVQAPTDETRES